MILSILFLSWTCAWQQNNDKELDNTHCLKLKNIHYGQKQAKCFWNDYFVEGLAESGFV